MKTCTKLGLAVLSLLLFFSFILSCSKEPLQGVRHASFSHYSSLSNEVSLSDINYYVQRYSGKVSTKGTDFSVEPVELDGDTVLYLVNYDEGWEILSADRRAPRCFAMAKAGNLSISQISDVPALNCLYNDFKQNVSYLKKNPGLEMDQNFDDKWDNYLSRGQEIQGWELYDSLTYEQNSVQNHLTTTQWGQGALWNCRSPYTNNTQTTHCYTGCVPVAASQVLYYLHQKIGVPSAAYGDCVNNSYIPTGSDSLVLSSNDVVFDTTSLSSSTWSNMALTNIGLGSFVPVSTLMTQLGLYLGAKYYVNGTSAVTANIQSVFQTHFNIESYGRDSVDFQEVTDQIMIQKMPVILSISYRDENEIRHGHCVVADACLKHYSITIYQYRRPLPMNPDDPFAFSWEFRNIRSTELLATYVGINWGWNGQFMESGGQPIWFSADAISWDVGSYCYTSLDYMIYGFYSSNS